MNKWATSGGGGGGGGVRVSSNVGAINLRVSWLVVYVTEHRIRRTGANFHPVNVKCACSTGKLA